MKQTFNPSNIKKKKTHGFRARMSSPNGRKTINFRRGKKRKRITK